VLASDLRHYYTAWDDSAANEQTSDYSQTSFQVNQRFQPAASLKSRVSDLSCRARSCHFSRPFYHLKMPGGKLAARA